MLRLHCVTWFAEHGASAAPIPLAFKTSDTNFFVKLCKRYRYLRRSKRRNDDFPEIRTLLIASKKTGYLPFQAEAIQCSIEYAIVDAGDDSCAYILKRGKPQKHENAVYYLHAKFCYSKQKKTRRRSSTMDEDGGMEATMIEAESNGTPGLWGRQRGLNKMMLWETKSPV